MNYTEEYERLIFTKGRIITLLPGHLGKVRGLPEKRKKNYNQYFILILKS